MSSALQLLLAGLLCVNFQFAIAYELATHALVTFRAYRQSVLTTDALTLDNLGLLNPTANSAAQSIPLGEIYLDRFSPQSMVRRQLPFEIPLFPDIKDTPNAGQDGFAAKRDQFNVSGWLMSGAMREDDNLSDGAFDDPYVPKRAFNRVFNHFFDPTRNRPLKLTPMFDSDPINAYYASDTYADAYVYTAPDWALGSDDAFATSPMRGTNLLNHFTILDARESMWRALTLKQIESTGLLHDIPLTTIPGNSSSVALRSAYWATTFRALGDVLHLNQDMAQPQHTRNEAHSGKGWGWPTTQDVIRALVTGHESVLEKYIDARARNDKRFDLNGVTLDALAPLEYPPYPAPQFGRYSDYWSTGIPPGSPKNRPQTGYVSGKGLADYSNRGFFTVVQNFGTQDFSHPSSIRATTR